MLITDLKVGGAPLHLRQLACALDPDQFDIQIASLAPGGPVSHQLRQNGFVVHALGARNIWDIKILFRLARLIHRFQPDVLHCLLIHANIVGRLVGRLCGVPHIIAAIHTAEHQKRWHLLLENLTCRLSRKTVCVSPSVYRHTLTQSHVPTARLCLIENGINIDHFAQAAPLPSDALGLDTDKKTLLFVGRLDPVKGIDLLLQALNLLKDTLPLQLLIAGDGPRRPHLEQLAHQLQIAPQVHFLGARHDIPNLLKSADLLVMPSHWEGLPLAALEAMAAGLPVAASRVEGLIDIIEDQHNGFLFEKANVQDLKSTIKKALLEPKNREKIVINASKTVKNRFFLKKMSTLYSNLYLSNEFTTPKTASPAT